MAIYHYAVHKMVSRGGGKSSVRSAAYLCRERFRDERTHELYDYRPKRSGIERASAYIDRAEGFEEGRKAALFTGLYGPAGAPAWTRGRENIAEFWNRLEAFEKHDRAQLATPIDIALPHELTLDQNRVLIQDHIRERFTRRGFVVQLAIHEPEHGEGRNVHAHLLVSTRQVDERGFVASKAANREHFIHRSEYVQDLREHWERTTNRHLQRHGHEIRIDRRTLREQGIERAPTLHRGPWRDAAERERQALDRAHRERETQQPERTFVHEDRESTRQEITDLPGRGYLAAKDRVAEQEQRAQDYARSLIQRDRDHRQHEAEIEQPTATPKIEAPRAAENPIKARLRAMDDYGLAREIRLANSSTIEGIAREISGDYAAPNARLDELQEERHSLQRHIDWYTQDAADAIRSGNQRWETLGQGLGMGQLGHWLGVKRDKYLSHYEHREAEDRDKIAERGKRLGAVDQAIGAAEQERAAALEAIRPQAEQELARRQETAELARQVIAERKEQARQREIERQRAIERAEQRWGQDREQVLEQERAKVRQEWAQHPERAQARSLDDAALRREAHVRLAPTGGLLTTEDLVLEMSPTYAAHIADKASLKGKIDRAQREFAEQQHDRDRHEQQRDQRWQFMGVFAKAMHWGGIWPDGAIEQHEAAAHKAEYEAQKAMLWLGTLDRELDETTRKIEAAFAEIRPAAEQELARRRQRAELAQEVQRERQDERQRLHKIELTMERQRERYGLEPRYGRSLEYGRGLEHELRHERGLSLGWER